MKYLLMWMYVILLLATIIFSDENSWHHKSYKSSVIRILKLNENFLLYLSWVLNKYLSIYDSSLSSLSVSKLVLQRMSYSIFYCKQWIRIINWYNFFTSSQVAYQSHLESLFTTVWCLCISHNLQMSLFFLNNKIIN